MVWPVVVLALAFLALLGLRVVILLILRRGETGRPHRDHGPAPRIVRGFEPESTTR